MIGVLTTIYGHYAYTYHWSVSPTQPKKSTNCFIGLKGMDVDNLENTEIKETWIL